jgi:peptidoglycan/xylan/chitin deacetylase (PgdA/CDA1 family)
MYHYVRDCGRTAFPRIKACHIDTFRRHVVELKSRFTMASMDEALAYLSGEDRSGRKLCLLTFDDGLKDHYADVMPILDEHRVPAVFFVSTGCLEGRVASVHKNHFLMAGLDFASYRQAVFSRLRDLSPGATTDVSVDVARRTYRWDTPEVAQVKYLVNFHLRPELRDQVFASLFAEHFGDEQAFARDLYMSWDETRAIQRAGHTIGGHSHDHVALGTVTADRARTEITTCRQRLAERLDPQPSWPFAYPYGSYDEASREETECAGFACAFTTRDGDDAAGVDLFTLRRTDANDAVRP